MSAAFCGPDAPEYVAALLAPDAIAAGFFNPVAVARLLGKCRSSASISENDNMALAGIVSTQLWYETFIQRFDSRAVAERTDIVTVGASEPLVAAM